MVETETRKLSDMDSTRFRRSQRLQSILGKLRQISDEESNLSGLPAVKPFTPPMSHHEQNRSSEMSADSASFASIQDKERPPSTEARTEESAYENERFVVDNDEPREGPTNEERNAPESREEANVKQSREDLIRQRINVAVMDSMASTDGDDNKMTTFSIVDKKATNQASGQSSSPTARKADLKVTIGDTVVDGNRIASPTSPKKRASPLKGVLSSQRGGRKASPRKKVLSFFDPNSDSSESDSSDDQLSFARRKSPRTAKRSPRVNVKKGPLNASPIQSKSVSSDDSDRPSIMSSDSSGSDYTSTSSDNGYSTASSLKYSKIKLAIDTKYQIGEEAKVTSPIAEQASEFISQLVRNLQLQQTFGVPEKIRKHTESQPIVAMERRDTVSSDESEEDEDDRSSIIKDDSTAPPKMNVMDELREKLAARAQKIKASTTDGTDEKATSQETRKKELVLQELEEAQTYVETDTSMHIQLQPTSGACGTFLACFGESAEVKQPPIVTLREAEFLTVKEASLALDDSTKWATKWGGVSPMASKKEKGKIASRSVRVHSESGNVNLSMSSDSEDTWEESVKSKDDDYASLAYSLATEDAREGANILQSCSDDSSMVPLRHGERERTKPSMSMLPDDSAEKTIRQHGKEPSTVSSSDQLAIVLSLSSESNKAMRSPQSVANLGDDPPAKTQAWTPSHFRPKRDEKHQEELESKIQEFQQRNAAVSSDDYLPPKNIQRLPVRSSMEVPKASNKIAQAYVDALSKKMEDNTIPAVKVSSDEPINGFKGQSGSMKPASTDLSDDVIPAPEQKAAHKHTQSLQTKVNDSFSAFGNLSVDVQSQDAGVNMGELVLRIDDVVQRLVQSGKIDVDAGPSRGSELEKKTSRENTAELLQNLAILRARSSSRVGSFSRSSHISVNSSPITDIPRSIPVKAPALSTSAAESLPREESTNLQRLRAKRDQAAMAVRDRAERLKGMSRDSKEYGREKNPILVENLAPENDSSLKKNPIGMYIEHSFSSAKANGPPKPESFSKRLPAIPSGEGAPHRHTQILRVEDRVEAGDRSGSSEIFKNLSKPLAYDMASWEQQPKESPVLLQPSGKYDSNGAAYDHDSSFDEDEATDYGSDDDSQQIDRIEIMIQELRARRMRL